MSSTVSLMLPSGKFPFFLSSHSDLRLHSAANILHTLARGRITADDAVGAYPPMTANQSPSLRKLRNENEVYRLETVNRWSWCMVTRC